MADKTQTMGNPETPAKDTGVILQAVNWNDATWLSLTASHAFELLSGVQAVFDRIVQGTTDTLQRCGFHLREMRTQYLFGSSWLPDAIAMRPDNLR